MLDLGLITGVESDYKKTVKCVTKMFRSIYKPDKRGITRDLIDPCIEKALSEYNGGIS